MTSSWSISPGSEPDISAGRLAGAAGQATQRPAALAKGEVELAVERIKPADNGIAKDHTREVASLDKALLKQVRSPSDILSGQGNLYRVLSIAGFVRAPQ